MVSTEHDRGMEGTNVMEMITTLTLISARVNLKKVGCVVSKS